MSRREDSPAHRHFALWQEWMPYGLELPGFAAAQFGDVCGVVEAMPLVEQGCLLDGRGAALGVEEAALPLGWVEGLQHGCPAAMNAGEDSQRESDGAVRVGERGPCLFVVAGDDGRVLGEGEADADEGVHMAVGDVVDELADGPSAVAVGRVDLGVGESGGGVLDRGGQSFDGCDRSGYLGFGDAGWKGEVSNRITWVGLSHCNTGGHEPLLFSMWSGRILSR